MRQGGACLEAGFDFIILLLFKFILFLFPQGGGGGEELDCDNELHGGMEMVHWGELHTTGAGHAEWLRTQK